MKILFVITGLGMGGAEKQLFNLVTSIKDDLDVRVVSFVGGPYVEKLKKEEVDADAVGVKSKLQFWKAYKSLKRIINKEDPDIVHSFLPHANIVSKLVKLFSRNKFKLICSVRVKEIKFLMQNLGERLLDFNCDLITTNSRTTKRFLVKRLFFDSKKVKVVYNGMKFPKGNEVELDSDKKKILTVAQFREQKDYETNVETVEMLKGMRDDFVFLYVGDGALKDKIKGMVKGKGLRNHVRFLGVRDDVPDLMKSSDVFFLPTLYEGQSNVLIEAMHYGCPIVTTGIPENKEVVNGAALLVGRKDPKEMAEAVDKLLEDENLKNELAEKGKERSRIFNLDRMVEAYKGLYERCAE